MGGEHVFGNRDTGGFKSPYLVRVEQWDDFPFAPEQALHTLRHEERRAGLF